MIQFKITLREEEVVEALFNTRLDDSDLLDLICALDLRVADAGFTELLIKRLVTSLKGDLEPEDWAKLHAELNE